MCGCDVILKFECVEIDFKVFIKIYFYFIVCGCNFKVNVVECVIKLFYDKYCLVLIMLEKMVEIMYFFEIIDDLIDIFFVVV